MDEIDNKGEVSKSSAVDESGDSAAKHEKPVSQFVLLIVLLRVLIFASLGIFYIKYCGGLKEDDSDSEGKAKWDTE